MHYDVKGQAMHHDIGRPQMESICGLVVTPSSTFAEGHSLMEPLTEFSPYIGHNSTAVGTCDKPVSSMSAETQLEKIRSELDMERMRTKLAVTDLSRLEAVVRRMEEQLQSLQTEVALGRSDQRVLWDSYASLSSTYAQQAQQLRDFLAFFRAERLNESVGQSSPYATPAKNDLGIQMPAHRKDVQRSAADAPAPVSSFKRSLDFWMERLSHGASEACADAKDGECMLPQIGSDPTCAEQQQQQQHELQQTQCAQQRQLFEQTVLHWPLSMGSGEQVQRLGRFTVFAPANNIASPPAASTALDASSLHARTPELSGVNVEEVHTVFASTKSEVGALFEKMCAHVLDVMATHELPREHAAKSRNGNTGFNLSDSTSATSSQHRSVSAASSGVSPNHHVEADEVLNLWETLGKPIERTTRRNRALEDENQRLKTEVALKMRRLQELQHRAQTQTQAQTVSPDGGASTRSSTRASTPTRRSSVTASVQVTASATSALLGNSGPPALDEAALPSSGTSKSPPTATGSSSSSYVPHMESSAATQASLSASGTSSGALSGAFGGSFKDEFSPDVPPLGLNDKPPSPSQARQRLTDA